MADMRTNLKDILDRVKGTHERIAVTRHGEVDAILISPDDLYAIEETLEILSDPEEMAAIRQAKAELDRGEGIPLDVVLREEEQRRRKAS